MHSFFRLTIAILLAALHPGYADNKILLPKCNYGNIFRKLSLNNSTTALRVERRRVVTKTEADSFLNEVATLLGDHLKTDPEQHRMQPREQPQDPESRFYTLTDYLPKFLGQDPGESSKPWGAVIRIRTYLVVPKDTTAAQVAENLYPTQKLVDQAGEYAKLEFKVGHIITNESGQEIEMPGVVEKSFVTLAKQDIALLLKDKDSFEKEKKRILANAKKLTLTRNGKTSQVNDRKQLTELLKRIELIYQQPNVSTLSPDYQTLYQRSAKMIRFQPKATPTTPKPKPFDVQITVDRDIRFTYYQTKPLNKQTEGDRRIIELKIPTEYAHLRDEELNALGLAELAQIRARYLLLYSRDEVPPDAGKSTYGGKLDPQPAP